MVNNNVWQDDKMDREEIAQVIDTQIEKYFSPDNGTDEEGFVIGVYGGYGTGKTFFLKKYAESLKEKYNVESINIKSVELSSDPFVEILYKIKTICIKINTEIKRSQENESDLKHSIDQGLDTAWKKVTSSLKKITDNMTVSGEINLGIAKVSISENLNNIFDSPENHLDDFRNALNEILGDNKVIICIDELDRCNPDFVVNFINIITHFFAISKLVFVLGVNQSYVQKSIAHVYNKEIATDGEGYLTKFINFSIELPLVLDNLIETYIETYNIQTKFGELFKDSSCDLKTYIKKNITHFDVSIRLLDKIFKRLELFLLQYKTIVDIEPNLHFTTKTSVLSIENKILHKVQVLKEAIENNDNNIQNDEDRVNINNLKETREVLVSKYNIYHNASNNLKTSLSSKNSLNNNAEYMNTFIGVKLIVYLAILYETKKHLMPYLYNENTWTKIIPIIDSEENLMLTVNNYAFNIFFSDMYIQNTASIQNMIDFIYLHVSQYITIDTFKNSKLEGRVNSNNSIAQIIQVYADICIGKIRCKHLKTP